MDYETWKRQVEESEDMSIVFRQDPKKAREFFPRYVKERFRAGIGIRFCTLSTPDYNLSFKEDVCKEFLPEVRMYDRRFRRCFEEEGQTIKEVAEYAVRVLSRKGVSRFLLNTLPAAIANGLSAIDDFWHDHVGHPLKMWWKKLG